MREQLEKEEKSTKEIELFLLKLKVDKRSRKEKIKI